MWILSEHLSDICNTFNIIKPLYIIKSKTIIECSTYLYLTAQIQTTDMSVLFGSKS